MSQTVSCRCHQTDLHWVRSSFTSRCKSGWVQGALLSASSKSLQTDGIHTIPSRTAIFHDSDLLCTWFITLFQPSLQQWSALNSGTMAGHANILTAGHPCWTRDACRCFSRVPLLLHLDTSHGKKGQHTLCATTSC